MGAVGSSADGAAPRRPTDRRAPGEAITDSNLPAAFAQLLRDRRISTPISSGIIA
jgi:hypothetical protein